MMPRNRVRRDAARRRAGRNAAKRRIFAIEAFESRLLLAGMPVLDTGVLVPGANGALRVGGTYGFTSPVSADWNADGRKDLLVGQFQDGQIWAFYNQGTDGDPTYTAGTGINSNGATLTTSYG